MVNEAPRISESLPVSEGVHRTIEIARREAGRYSSTRVDTEHLLLGLLQHRKRRKNLLTQHLEEFGVTLRKVRERIESVWEPETGAEEEVEFAFTPRSRDVVERAKQQARQRGNIGMDPPHLLLALLEEPEGGAARVLSDLGVDRERLGQTTLR